MTELLKSFRSVPICSLLCTAALQTALISPAGAAEDTDAALPAQEPITVGTVEELDKERGKVRVVVSMFGRETPVELDLDQVEAI